MSARLPIFLAERPYEPGDLSHVRPGPYDHEDALRAAIGAHLHDVASEVGAKPRSLYWWIDRHEPSRPGPGRRLSRLLRTLYRDHRVAPALLLEPVAIVLRDLVAVCGADPRGREPLARLATSVAGWAGFDVVKRVVEDLTPAGTLDRVRRCTAEQADVMRAALAGADGWTEEELAALEREVGELVTAAHALLRGARAERRGNGGGAKKP